MYDSYGEKYAFQMGVRPVIVLKPEITQEEIQIIKEKKENEDIGVKTEKYIVNEGETIPGSKQEKYGRRKSESDKIFERAKEASERYKQGSEYEEEKLKGLADSINDYYNNYED